MRNFAFFLKAAMWIMIIGATSGLARAAAVPEAEISRATLAEPEVSCSIWIEEDDYVQEYTYEGAPELFPEELGRFFSGESFAVKWDVTGGDEYRFYMFNEFCDEYECRYLFFHRTEPIDVANVTEFHGEGEIPEEDPYVIAAFRYGFSCYLR